jgi:predicted transcriptional regulator
MWNSTVGQHFQKTSSMIIGDSLANLVHLTARIVSAYVSHNAVVPADLPHLIDSVHQTLRDVERATKAGTLKPAVPIAMSVSPTYIICLEDGRKLKSLRRHLTIAHKLTPAAYRLRWGLPPDHPIVAPVNARQRSRLAKKNGLGTRWYKDD